MFSGRLSCRLAWSVGANRVVKPFVPAAIFIVLNCSLWYFNRVALFFVSEAVDRDLTPVTYWMTVAYRNHIFEILGTLIAISIVFAVIKRNSQMVFFVSTIGALFWLLIYSFGYVFVSISMLDV